jgi:hypothetical protein
MLTPYQVQQLSARKQVEHAQYIGYFKGFDAENWQKETKKTFYPDGWWLD